MRQHDLHVGGVGVRVVRGLRLVQVQLAPQELVPLLLWGEEGRQGGIIKEGVFTAMEPLFTDTV